MNIIEIITKKRDKKELSREEIEYFVTEYVKGSITDYQASALIMAIYLNGMTKEETKNLTLAMAYSGEVLDLSQFGENVVDKHSTGGVGDKITIVLLPIIASLGIPVAKMSGRGLGITGGTIDKLESIPGYNTSIDIDNFIKNVQEVGISIIGQTMNMAPADKKMYALRDTIACIDSMPLIVSSIMSKKIAAGANKIVLEVTVGSGAFMKTKEQAVVLSEMMKEIGRLANKETVCILTNMSEPIGKMVGNVLEIKEAIECLKGNMPEDVKTVVLEIGSYMIKLAGLNDDLEVNKKMIMENIENGKAYKKFLELVEIQGGNIAYIENVELLEKAQNVIEIKSEKEGWIKELDAQIIGEVSSFLGAGRIRKEDKIDMAVGIELNKKIGDKVLKGEILLKLHINDLSKLEQAKQDVLKAYKIAEYPIEKPKHIL